MDTDRGETWTKWYNVDRPFIGSGDYETVKAVLEYAGEICRTGFSIVATECKKRGESVVFDEYSVPSDIDKLYVPCTRDGIVCRNEDQGPDALCGDYSIRFHCRYMDANSAADLFPEFDVRIYIVLAVVPVLIFLIRLLWAYVFRRRRQRRREARRARRRLGLRSSSDDDDDDDDDDDGDSSSILSALALPPPSYNDLFGYNSQQPSIFSISGGSLPVCQNCKGRPCGQAKSVGNSSNNNGSTPSTSTNTSDANPSSNTTVSTSNANTPADSYTPASTHDSVALENGQTNIQREHVQQTENSYTSGDTNGSQHTNNGNDLENERLDQEAFSGVTPADDDSSRSVILDLSEANSIQNTSENNMSRTVGSQHAGSERNSSSSSSSPRERSSDNSATDSSISSESTVITPVSTSPLDVSTPSSHPLALSMTDANPNTSVSDMSQQCSCICHRAGPFSGPQTAGGVSGYENGAFTLEGDHPSNRSNNGAGQYHGRHIPALPRVWSNLSNTSVVTLTELPSYEDALELMKKKKEEQLVK